VLRTSDGSAVLVDLVEGLDVPTVDQGTRLVAVQECHVWRITPAVTLSEQLSGKAPTGCDRSSYRLPQRGKPPWCAERQAEPGVHEVRLRQRHGVKRCDHSLQPGPVLDWDPSRSMSMASASASTASTRHPSLSIASVSEPGPHPRSIGWRPAPEGYLASTPRRNGRGNTITSRLVTGIGGAGWTVPGIPGRTHSRPRALPSVHVSERPGDGSRRCVTTPCASGQNPAPRPQPTSRGGRSPVAGRASGVGGRRLSTRARRHDRWRTLRTPRPRARRRDSARSQRGRG